MLAKEYKIIMNECFDCRKKLIIKPGKKKILTTTIIDFPFLQCPECETEWISAEFIEPIMTVLSQYDIYPKEMTLFNIKQIDKDEIMRFY